MDRSALRHVATAITHVRRVWLVVAVAIAVALVSIVTLDLGPVLRRRVEAEASAWVARPVHIGRLGLNVGRGHLVLQDVVVEGGTPANDPWLRAGRIELALTWNALLGREVLFDDAVVDDWTLLIESYAGAVNNMPRLGGPPRPTRTGPPLVRTTLSTTRLSRGHLIIRDYGSSWGLDAPNLELRMSKGDAYAGTMSWRGGTLLIQQYEPMWAHGDVAFHVVEGKISLDALRLTADGGVLDATGLIDPPTFPNATYQLSASLALPRTRAIFFAKDTFTLDGAAAFTGQARLYKGGYEVTGDFTSPLVTYNGYDLDHYRASMRWVPTRLETTSDTGFYGGTTHFTYTLDPLGNPERRADAVWDVEYSDVDLTRLTDFLETRGMRLAGHATGRNLMRWRLGGFAEATGEGALAVSMPAGLASASRELPDDAAAAARDRATFQEPFSPHIAFAPVAVAAAVDYAFTGETVTFAPSHIATAETFVAFDGRTDWGHRSRLPLHVTSTDWQASHRVLAGVMTMFATPTSAVPVAGVGEFDGVLTGELGNPRVEGAFSGHEMRAWNVTWGDLTGRAVIENAYAYVTDGVITQGPARMDIDGQFALGYPRRDGGDEIDARIRATEWPITDLRRAFELYDYPVFGAVNGEIRLDGRYEEPFGFGRVSIDRGTAYDEPFASGSASLRFEGPGVRLDGLEIRKAGATITGAAYVAWAGTYSFNADGRRLAVDALDLTYFPGLPALTGYADFSAAGSGTFDEPRYDVRVNVSDLFFGEEGVGEMTAQVGLRGLTVLYSFDLASPRLAASGSGQFGLTEAGEIEMTMRLSDTSLDPYARVMMPTLSPYTTAIGGGSVRVWGQVYAPDGLHVASRIDDLRLRLFDYELRNRGELQVGLDGQLVRIDAFALTGDRTALDVTGQVDLARDVVALRANGDANLAVLQGMLPGVRGSGRAELAAQIGGSTAEPTISGRALVSEGRLRTFAFPHALEAINGIVQFDATSVRLDGLRARLADGTVLFGGRLGLKALVLADYDVTLTGHDLRLRYPEGMRSLVDAALTVQGPAGAPVVGGSVLVRNAVWTPAFDGTTNLFGGSGSEPVIEPGPGVAGAVAATAESAVRFDVRLVAPSTFRIENDLARIVASADLTLRGSPERPQVFGRADIERGEVRFEGRRYLVTRGSLDFTNPDRVQPFFDVEADTRVRVPGQTYRVTLRIAGTTERLQPEFTSDPPLPSADVLSLLLSDRTPAGDVEVTSINAPNQREVDLLQSRATRALTGALSAEVGKVVQETFGVDTFQITPLLVDPYQQAAGLAVNPAARVTIGKRLSDRIYLTYARSLSSSTRDEIILLEYDQSETLGWVLSQNEDGTYALEVRKRVAF